MFAGYITVFRLSHVELEQMSQHASEYNSTDGCQAVTGTWVNIGSTIISMELNVSSYAK